MNDFTLISLDHPKRLRPTGIKHAPNGCHQSNGRNILVVGTPNQLKDEQPCKKCQRTLALRTRTVK